MSKFTWFYIFGLLGVSTLYGMEKYSGEELKAMQMAVLRARAMLAHISKKHPLVGAWVEEHFFQNIADPSFVVSHHEVKTLLTSHGLLNEDGQVKPVYRQAFTILHGAPDNCAGDKK